MCIGENIKYYRLKQKLTQKELAKQLFVSEKTIGHWETGKRIPSIDKIQTLSNALEVTIEDMLEKRENILLMYFSFLLQDEHYLEHYEMKRGYYRIVLQDKTLTNAPKIYLDIEQNMSKASGVYFHTEKTSWIGFSKESDMVYEIDAPDWYINLFLQAMDTYQILYKERVKNPEKKRVLRILTEFFLRHKRDDRDMFLKSRLHYFETYGIAVPDKELFEILKNMYIEEGYDFHVPIEEKCYGYIHYPEGHELKELVYLKDRMTNIVNNQIKKNKR